MLTYLAGKTSGDGSLLWTHLSVRADQLDPHLMRLAFVFILVGFGTKAGFAPMHTWLADAHSQAPSPVSGLLSGVLLSCALVGILRFQALTQAATGSDFSSELLIAFGLLSVAVAAPFILLARDVKRMLAYSSIEHMGLIAIAFGIGGPIGISAGLLHIVNHAATKGLLFFATGDIVQRNGDSRRIGAIRGLLKASPFVGWLFLLGILAITGSPPFGIFISELGIVTAGFTQSRVDLAVVVTALLLLGIIFAGMLRHAIAMCVGGGHHVPGERPAISIDLPGRLQLAAFAPLAVIVILFGVHVPGPINRSSPISATLLNCHPERRQCDDRGKKRARRVLAWVGWDRTLRTSSRRSSDFAFRLQSLVAACSAVASLPGARLATMVGEDDRAESDAFRLSYTFALPEARWFTVEADVDPAHPEFPPSRAPYQPRTGMSVRCAISSDLCRAATPIPADSCCTTTGRRVAIHCARTLTRQPRCHASSGSPIGSTRCTAKASSRFRSARSMPASSSRVISGSPRSASASSTSKRGSSIPIAASRR